MPDQPTDSLAEERARTIAELERSVGRRRFGVRWTTALVGLALSVGLLWMERRDLAYLASPREPITLGNEEGYHFDRLASNRYAQIHGIPTTNAAFARSGDQVHVVVGLRNTPVLVRRAALPTEEWHPKLPPPRPDPRPFGVRGRLLARADAKQYEQGFQLLEREVAPRDGGMWILLEGERPGSDVGTLFTAGFLVALAILNAWLGARDLAARWIARRHSAGIRGSRSRSASATGSDGS